MNYGFVKTACATPTIKVADCVYNSEQIISQISYMAENGAAVAVFPELCVTGYTCGDLFLQPLLIEQAECAVENIIEQTKDIDLLFAIGAPVAVDDALYNCAVVIYKGAILGIVPKTNIPNYNELGELRYFTSGLGVDIETNYASQQVKLSPDLVFCCDKLPQLKIGVEICEDLMAPCSPSQYLALDGKAAVILNLAASNEYAGKSDYRRDLVKVTSGKLCCAYLFCSAGPSESTTDAVFSAHNIIAENGEILSESKKFSHGVIYADIDVEKLTALRRKNNNFTSISDTDIEYVSFDMPKRETPLAREFSRQPFMPSEKSCADSYCEDILTMQALGLATRMQNAHVKDLVLGVSGGLDSTLALIVGIKALDILKLDHSHLHCVSMPCFGTTNRTKSNAEKLSVAYGAQFKMVDITQSVRQHFADIDHSESDHDTTYENSQARLRTMVLMDISNKLGALVVGTGDLSELALGWATYNGDHMSMYAVNASVPKTMVRYLVDFQAQREEDSIKAVLLDILDTPVSPELLPPDESGNIAQITEDVVGPYELHDFFLYHFLSNGYSPKKIYHIAVKAFENVYDKATIKHWLKKFFSRFFTQQFKRSCMPDGPKVSALSLSPRTDLKMPSDAQSKLWLSDIDEL